MLVLSRKKSEMIHIGGEIIVKVIQTGRSSVKIGIEAPENVRVLRAELCPSDTAHHSLATILQERRQSRVAAARKSSLPESAN
jgi:carbon storage regulator